jgi:predicted dehydrogenase
LKILRVGIIGCGTIFPMHAQSLKKIKGVRLAAVCDIRFERARRQARRYRSAAYKDYRRMLKKERLDAVHICTPHYLHATMALEAVKAGVNVLTEKPMAITPRDAASEIAAAKKNNVTLGVIFQNRFNPGSRLVKKNLQNGRLGKIKAARIVMSYHKPDEYYRKSDWKGRREKEGGGVVIDQAIHFIDLVRWFVNDAVDYVEANTSRRMHSFIDVEDCAEGVIRFKRGAYVTFYLMNFYSYDDDVEIEIDCEKGRVKIIKDSATIKFSNGGKLYSAPKKNEYIDYGGGVRDYWGYCHYHQIRDFYDSLRRSRKPAVDGLEGLKTQAIVSAIYESSAGKKRVYLKG